MHNVFNPILSYPIISFIPISVELIHNWIKVSIEQGAPPTVQEIKHFTKLNTSLRPSMVIKTINNTYKEYGQTQGIGPRKKEGQIIVNTSNLYSWMGDLCFLHQSLAGFQAYDYAILVLVNSLSRLIIYEIVHRSKSSKDLLTSFILAKQRIEDVYDLKIMSLSFDSESGILSHQFQAYLKSENIAFHNYIFSPIKASLAENSILYLRKTLKRSEIVHENMNPYRIIQSLETGHNNQYIFSNGKRLKFKHKDVTPDKLGIFLEALYQTDSKRLFSMYKIDPNIVKFKYPVGAYVNFLTKRRKGAAGLGPKRSTRTLTSEIFIIIHREPILNNKYEVGKSYMLQQVSDYGQKPHNTRTLTAYENDIVLLEEKET